MGFNPIHMPIIANVVSGPERRVIPNTEKEITELRVAVDHGYWDKQTQAEVKTGTSYFKVVCEGKLGESVAQTNYTPGTRVLIFGNYTSKEYEKKDGSKGIDQRIKAEDMGPSNLFSALKLPERRSGGGQQPAPRQAQASGYGSFGGGDDFAPAYRDPAPQTDPWATATPGDPWQQ